MYIVVELRSLELISADERAYLKNLLLVKNIVLQTHTKPICFYFIPFYVQLLCLFSITCCYVFVLFSFSCPTSRELSLYDILIFSSVLYVCGLTQLHIYIYVYICICV